MKVLIINSFYFPNKVGGAEKSVQIMAEALVKKGHQVCIFTLACRIEQKYSVYNGVHVYYIKPFVQRALPTNQRRNLMDRILFQISSDWFDHVVYKALGSCIDKEQPDVIHVNNLAGLTWRAAVLAKERNIPVVHTLRDYYQACFRQSMFKDHCICKSQCRECSVLTTRRKKYSNDVDVVVGNSRYTLDAHLSNSLFIDTKLQDVVFNGYKPLIEYMPRTLENGKTVFGFIGQIIPSKGVSELLQALESLSDDSVTLLIAGEGRTSYVSDLKARYSDKRVTWLGWTNTEDFFLKIDFLVIPSLWPEPLPRVAYEAYSYGVPVIASNSGGTKEIVQDGVTGWIFDPFVKKDYSDKLNLAINSRDDYKKMSEQCLEMSKQFTPEHVVDCYEEIFIKAVNNDF